MIQIEEIMLRIPGVDESAARFIAQEVSQRLSGLHGSIKNIKIDELDLRIMVNEGAGIQEITDNISTRLVQQLGIK